MVDIYPDLGRASDADDSVDYGGDRKGCSTPRTQRSLRLKFQILSAFSASRR